jgi:putative spermidine/putrescine transport system ATP-binding protein
MTARDYVEFRDVTKTYDGHGQVIHDLNFSVAKGEFVTMLGPSGSGKTTCLMMLAGFEAPSGGEIQLAGRSIQHVAPHRRNIGMVFQNYALFPHMTIAENLAYPLRTRRMRAPEIKVRVESALEMVQMSAFAGRRPHQLSGGQQQRIALARALVFEPDLVLMDEPLGALDRNLREHLQYEIKQLHRKLGITIIYVTHDQSEALTMSDRIAVFNGGRIEQIGDPAEIYERPKSAFVAGFIGESNRLGGVVIGASGDLRAVDVGRGVVITGTAVAGCAEGSQVLVSLRPERLKVGNHGAGLANRLVGRIRELVYLGDHLRVVVGMDGEQALIAKLHNGEKSAGIELGATCALSWDAGDCVILPAEETQPASSTHLIQPGSAAATTVLGL